VKKSLFEEIFALLLSSHFREAESVTLRFALAEGLVRMGLSTIHHQNGKEFFSFPPIMFVLLNYIEQRVSLLSSISAPVNRENTTHISEKDCSFCGILMLVWLKHFSDWLKYLRGFLCIDPNTVSPEVLTRSCVVFLRLIRGRHLPSFVNLPNTSSNGSTGSTDVVSNVSRIISSNQEVFSPGQPEPFLQDVCCAGLCFAYDIACSWIVETSSISSPSISSVGDKIASLVISTLCREKKSVQPAGVAVAGETTGSLSDQLSGRQNLEALMTRIESEQRQENTVLLPQGGTGNDILAAAVARAQAALNIYHATGNESMNNTGVSTNIQQGQEDNYSYGVYTKICKVAKKTGIIYIIFTLQMRF
jgi:hypothetical protein